MTESQRQYKGSGHHQDINSNGMIKQDPRINESMYKLVHVFHKEAFPQNAIASK